MSETKIYKVLDSLTISASGSILSEGLQMLLTQGDCSLEIDVSGAGTGKFEFLISNSQNTPYLLPDGGGTILSAQSGANIAKFTVPPCDRMQIRASEDGTTDSITVSAWLAVRRDR